MTTSPHPTDVSETPVWLAAPTGPLLAIVTEPRAGSAGAVLLCPGGWHGTATNRNRLLVRMARRLAATGRTVLRFDWHGVGESAGTLDRYALDTPFVDDVAVAAGHLLAAGHDRIDAVGVCFGAHSLLAASPELGPHLERVMLISFPMPDRVPQRGNATSTVDMLRLAATPSVLQTMADPSARRLYRRKLRTRWRRARGRSPGPPHQGSRPTFDPAGLHRQATRLVDAGVPTMMLFGEHDPYHMVLSRHRAELLDPLVERSAGLLRIEAEQVDLQGFGSLEAQQVAIDRTVSWLTMDPAELTWCSPVRRPGEPRRPRSPA